MREEVIATALIPTMLFGLIFGIVYLRNKENMSLISRGINPRVSDPRPSHFVNLKWSLLLVGAGLGLLIAYFIDANNTQWLVSAGGRKYREEHPAIYFSLIAIGGGLGLFISYIIERRYWDKQQQQSRD